MTFKKTMALSIILVFALGTFAMATTPGNTTSTTGDSQYTPTVASPQDSVNTTSSTGTIDATKTTTTTSASDKKTGTTKPSKTEKQPVKKGTSKQATTTKKTQPAKQKATSQNVTTVTKASPLPVYYYSNRNYGYNRRQIRSMPMVARPDRPGHFFGNTVRAIYRARRGR